MDKQLMNTIAWSGRTPLSPKHHAPWPCAEHNSVVVGGVVFTQAYTCVNGIRLHSLKSGNGEHPILLVHGFPAGSQGWESLMEALVRAGFTPMIADSLSAGETDIPLDGYDKKSMARDLRELLTLLTLVDTGR
ncbi:alpha/beta hydrolase [Pseudomonas sp. T1.Ur]|uniref:alpha/beta fold hydrolase n=1 Tax=Pseudomonas sp. T1.Ur TaxID=2928704 RepID=UPI00201D574C|nr:alpha/beta hydrolase [Pseudomonas sp. T1.Ur]MCL6704235.1 alpha/beta hydrolase [Pseudomonas sp. T1.Ur]